MLWGSHMVNLLARKSMIRCFAHVLNEFVVERLFRLFMLQHLFHTMYAALISFTQQHCAWQQAQAMISLLLKIFCRCLRCDATGSKQKAKPQTGNQKTVRHWPLSVQHATSCIVRNIVFSGCGSWLWVPKQYYFRAAFLKSSRGKHTCSWCDQDTTGMGYVPATSYCQQRLGKGNAMVHFRIHFQVCWNTVSSNIIFVNIMIWKRLIGTWSRVPWLCMLYAHQQDLACSSEPKPSSTSWRWHWGIKAKGIAWKSCWEIGSK